MYFSECTIGIKLQMCPMLRRMYPQEMVERDIETERERKRERERERERERDRER